MAQKYHIKKRDGTDLVGEMDTHFTGRGAAEWPTFKLSDNTLYSCHISRAKPITEEEYLDWLGGSGNPEDTRDFGKGA